jgi:hypothetical protein
VQSENKLRRYDQAVRHALTVAWEASDRVCGKRLKAVLPVLLPALERHAHLPLDPAVQAKLFAVSAATIDRLLCAERQAQAESRNGRASTIQRRGVFSPMLGGWQNARAGYVEMRLLCHREDRARGALQTLSLTDLNSGWVEYTALQVGGPSQAGEQSRGGEHNPGDVVSRLDALLGNLPFKVRGLVLGGGFDFCEESLLRYCSARGIEVINSRRRAGSWCDPVVPPLVGRSRLEGASAAEALARLYAAARLYINFFYCSFRMPPYSRLLISPALSAVEKSQLRSLAETLDPLQLLAEIRGLQTHLKILAAGFMPHSADARPGRTAVRRHWRTHQNAFESAWPTIQAWQAADPDQTGSELLQRLRRAHPGIYREGQLRSLQRQLKQWRSRVKAPTRDGSPEGNAST